MLTVRANDSFPDGIDLDAVNLDAEEWSSDINNVTSVLKLWLRELPEPVMTTVLHQHFIDAASQCLSYFFPNLSTPPLASIFRACTHAE